MSFRLYVYHSAFAGAWAGLLGWLLCRLLAPQQAFAAALVQGAVLGMVVAVGLACVDAFWTHAKPRLAHLIARVSLAMAVGGLGGLASAALGAGIVALVSSVGIWSVMATFVLLGIWGAMGVTIGAAVGYSDFWFRTRQNGSSWRVDEKVRNAILGGLLGGLAGGALHALFQAGLNGLLGADREWLSPSAVGFAFLGLALGLLIGLTQVVRKKAWLRVEAGSRTGRELILSHAETKIGREESCELGLLGSAEVEGMHARIVWKDGAFLLADAGSRSGTFVNDRRLTAPHPLQAGDLIRVGDCLLRFDARAAPR